VRSWHDHVIKSTDTPTADASVRSYNNAHRASQAAQTRQAIVDALVHVIGRGGIEFSVPAVAREAGVSIRTVYRNFPTKRDLLAALAYDLDERIGYSLPPGLPDLAALTANVRAYFHALAGMDDTIRAVWASQIAREARDSVGVPAKLAAIAEALDPMVVGRLSDSDRVRLFNVIATLFSQYTLQRMKDDLGVTADEAAESIVWAIQTLVGEATGNGSSWC
jgi:AcrR family transcriptional regulator